MPDNSGPRAVPGSEADRADRFALYEQFVQNPQAEIEFADATFRAVRGRRPHILREDFCGTAAVSRAWVALRPRNRAVGIDHDPTVLAWARSAISASLPRGAARRIELLQEDVLEASCDPADVLVASNFSYWTFRTRSGLARYFASTLRSLVADGLLILDAFGGTESTTVSDEKKTDGDVTYRWEQASYNPIDGLMRCHIHFAFSDGSRLERAFSYEWRLWTLPELQELLEEAGYSRCQVHWEGTDETTGEGDGVFTAQDEAQNDPTWICYLVAEK